MKFFVRICKDYRCHYDRIFWSNFFRSLNWSRRVVKESSHRKAIGFSEIYEFSHRRFRIISWKAGQYSPWSLGNCGDFPLEELDYFHEHMTSTRRSYDFLKEWQGIPLYEISGYLPQKTELYYHGSWDDMFYTRSGDLGFSEREKIIGDQLIGCSFPRRWGKLSLKYQEFFHGKWENLLAIFSQIFLQKIWRSSHKNQVTFL